MKGLVDRGLDVGSRLVVLPAALIVWEAIVRLLDVSPDKMPAPSLVLALIWRSRDVFAGALATTLYETLLGLAGGIVAGVASGIAFSQSRLLERMFLPYFIASQAVPIIAFGAIIIMWFGNGVASKVAIALYLSFFPVAVNALRGIASVDPGQIGLLRTFGAGRWDILRKLLLPAALPFIFTAIRLAASLALVGAIVGEWFGASRGLGVVLLTAMFDYRITHLWAGILLTGLAGMVLFWSITLIQRRIVWWQADE